MMFAIKAFLINAKFLATELSFTLRIAAVSYE